MISVYWSGLFIQAWGCFCMECECKPDRPLDPWAFSPEYRITSRGEFPDTPATDFSRASAEQWTKRSRGRLSMRRILIAARQAASGAALTQQTRQRQQAEGEFRGKYWASPVLCSATYNYLKRCNISCCSDPSSINTETYFYSYLLYSLLSLHVKK